MQHLVGCSLAPWPNNDHVSLDVISGFIPIRGLITLETILGLSLGASSLQYTEAAFECCLLKSTFSRTLFDRGSLIRDAALRFRPISFPEGSSHCFAPIRVVHSIRQRHCCRLGSSTPHGTALRPPTLRTTFALNVDGMPHFSTLSNGYANAFILDTGRIRPSRAVGDWAVLGWTISPVFHFNWIRN